MKDIDRLRRLAAATEYDRFPFFLVKRCADLGWATMQELDDGWGFDLTQAGREALAMATK